MTPEEPSAKNGAIAVVTLQSFQQLAGGNGGGFGGGRGRWFEWSELCCPQVRQAKPDNSPMIASEASNRFTPHLVLTPLKPEVIAVGLCPAAHQ